VYGEDQVTVGGSWRCMAKTRSSASGWYAWQRTGQSSGRVTYASMHGLNYFLCRRDGMPCRQTDEPLIFIYERSRWNPPVTQKQIESTEKEEYIYQRELMIKSYDKLPVTMIMFL
jgi:hypothetical protein